MKTKKSQDETLWSRFLSGDKKAYALIFERYVRVLFAYGSQFTDDRELVKDSIQDVFVKIYANRSRLSATDNVKYYLFGALRHSIVNSLRRSANAHKRTAHPGPGASPSEDSPPGIELREEEQALQEKVSRVMSALTPRQKQAIRYRYIDDLSIGEISDIMQMSYQAVLNIIQRALKRMRSTYPH